MQSEIMETISEIRAIIRLLEPLLKKLEEHLEVALENGSLKIE